MEETDDGATAPTWSSAGCEAGQGLTRVLSFPSPSGWRDQMTAFIGRREFIALLGGAAAVADCSTGTAADHAADRIPRPRAR